MLVAALLAGLGVFALTFYGSLRAASASMTPTLLEGDRFFFRRAVYDARESRAPARGEVVVFRSPDAPDREEARRVVGLPGDTIAIQGGALFINQWRVPTCFAGMLKLDIDGKSHSGGVLVELLEDQAYLVFHDETAGHLHADDVEGPYQVQHKEVFVLGDNRETSRDSRHWGGEHGAGLPLHRIRGRASHIWMAAAASDSHGKPSRGRTGTSLTGIPKCDAPFSPELCAGIERCLSNRPPRDKATPPVSAVSADPGPPGDPPVPPAP